jgi:Homeodomain-like domain
LHPRRLDGVQEAHLVTLACSPALNGRGRWTLRLLADKLVELDIVDGISHETVRQTLKKTELKLWLKKRYCLPEEPSGEFVYHMEDVLDVYTRPYDPRRPPGVSGRDQRAVDRREAHPSAHGTGATSLFRVRV